MWRWDGDEWRWGTSTASPGTPTAPVEFHLLQEYFHDGGSKATNETADLNVDCASFKSALTSSETAYIAAHHPLFAYFCTPLDLIQSTVSAPYPQTQLDSSYVTTMHGLVSQYGIDNMYLFAMPEWDNDPANSGWAYNRFSEAGVGGSRPDIPTGLTRQQAYDQWMHFYLADNHGGNTNHHQLGQILSVPLATRGYKVMANCSQAGSAFYGYEMGLDFITLQRANDDISGLIGGLALIRGAGAQYAKPWGIDISGWRTYWGTNEPMYNSSGVRQGGWSEGVLKQHYYLSFFSGALAVFEEAHDYNTNGFTNINGRNYTPFGTTVRDFGNFALIRHPQRGVPHVPIAIVKDHNSFWEPKFGQFAQSRAVWYLQMSANDGENMLYNLYDLIWPSYNTWGSSTTTTEPMGSGRWGEQFNILTEKATKATFDQHKVVMLSTNAVMDSTLQTKLAAYATSGGIVVINAKQLTGTAHETLTGVHVTGTASTSGTITWDSDASTTTEGSFNYSTVTLGTATNLAHSGASTPQVTKNNVGSGEVWVTMPDYLSNPANTATLNLATKLIDVLIDRFKVATISGGSHANIDYTITKQAGPSGTSVVVTVINTGSSTWTGTVSAPGTGTPVPREWISDTNASFSTGGGNVNISASVPVGDVKVYAIG